MLNDKGDQLFDGSKVSGLTGIHVLNASLEKNAFLTDIRPNLNHEVALHPGLRIKLNLRRVVNFR